MNSIAPARLRDLMQAADLFDEAFYAAAYGPLTSNDRDMLDRFIRVGTERGHLPSSRFDPLVYGYLVPKSRAVGPLVHYLQFPGDFQPPPLESLFPGCEPHRIHDAAPSPTDPEYVRACRTAAASTADPRSIGFTAAGRERRLEVPDGRLFLEQFRYGKPFAFARLPHGLWDSLLHRDAACAVLETDPDLAFLSAVQKQALATRVAGVFLQGNGVFHGSFIEELEDLVTGSVDRPGFHAAVAFRGYPGPDDALFAGPAPDDQRRLLDQLGRLFPESDRLLDATLWKRMAIAGTLAPFADICRRRHVILVASELFADLADRWMLPRFTHVVIPRIRSHECRWQIVAHLGRVLDMERGDDGPRPVVITQCGGSLACWLIARLFQDWPDVFFLDLGQALNAWFLDVADLPVLPWMQVYRRSIVDTPGFGAYYQARLGSAFTDWYSTLS